MRRIGVRHAWVAVLLGLSAVQASAATLSGRVTNPNGSGAYPIDIDIVDAFTGLPVVVASDTTDTAGNYVVTLPSGTYHLSFAPDSGTHLFTHIETALTLQMNAMLDVELLPGKYMSVRVTRPAGTGVRFVDLDFRSPLTGDPAVNVQGDLTDSLGFATALVDSGVWDVSLIAPLSERLVPQKLDAVDVGADIDVGTVLLPAGHLVAGTVTDQGFFPIADMDLDARPAGGGPKLFTPQDDTAPDGSYALMLPPGAYDVTASPAGSEPYAPATAREVWVAGDVTVPNLMLPPGLELRLRCRRGDGTAIPGVDLDVDSLPALGRLEVQNDLSDTMGEIRTLISSGTKRITLSPPVATKLLPVRLPSVPVSGPVQLGDVVFSAGQWVSGTVVEAGTGTPIQGANLDFELLPSGPTAITPGDVTDAAGFFRVVLAPGSYRVRVTPPTAVHDTLFVEPVAVSGDTVLALELTVDTVDLPAPGAAADSRLLLAGPNPMRARMRIGFRSFGTTDLAVFDVLGRRVATLYRGAGADPGWAAWGGRDHQGRSAPPGTYFVRLADAAGSAVRRFVKLQ